MSVADSAVGAILEIPDSALADIKKAEAAIKSLQATSATAAQKIKGHFDNTAVSGLNAFIKKVEDAKNRLGNIKMPTIDATGFATSISQIAQAMATVDKSATTGANRLSRIADSITKLENTQPNPQIFQAIANGISAIGNMSQQTITNVSMLAQTMAQLAKNIQTVQNAQRSMNNDTASVAAYNKLYKEQADLVRQKHELERKGTSITSEEQRRLDAIKNRYAEIGKQIDELNKKKQNAATSLARVAGDQRVSGATSRSTVSGAIDYARQSKDLRELQNAYKNLKAVMNTVDPKSKDWQQMNVVLQQTKTKIDSIRKAMGEFQNQSRMTGDSLGRLKGQIAAAFSVGAIMGYIKKMVEVRGQFELQNVALRAILQNKDEADKIFMQVQNMALQSPFSIMQMTTFTKQLAAYRIETEKLVGTTKMLADVSAGLGVDMGRLILAYGQVKSANYLRATEIRQFTEAGLNIAGELAQYFSELQGKMVSVGDVMEMVTKRMVRFEDVEEVFKRVTSAGGLFYDMQKKQSNTISGMLQRITDAWQIMLNDIGKSNQGTIRDALDLIRQMISHWRMLVPIIKTVGSLMAGAFIAKGIYSALLGMTKMVAAIKAITGGLNAMRVAAQTANLAFATTGIGALITLGLTLTSVFVGLNAEANKLNEELERIGQESFDDMNTSIANYVKLADTIRSANTSYTERQEAIEELNRTYKDILPTYLKEREYIDGNADSYATATKKIKEYYQAKEYQKKIEAVKSSGNFEKMVDELKGVGKRMTDYGWFDKEVPKAMVDSFMEQLANEFVSGDTEATLDAVAKRIKEYFGEKLHDTGIISKDWTGKVLETGDLEAILNSSGWNSLADAFEKWNKMKSSIEEAKFSLTTAASMEEQYAAAAKMHAQEVIDGAQKQINEINAQIQAYFALKTELEKLKAKGQWSAEEKERMVSLQGKIEQVSASFFAMANSVIPGLDKAFLSNINNVFDLESALDTVSQKAFPVLAVQGVNALKPVKGEVDALTQAVNMLLTQLGIAGQLAGNKGPYTAKDAPMMLTPEEQQKWADKQNEIWRKEQQTLQARVRERKKSNQEILQDEAKRYGIENALANKQILIQERTNKEYAADLRALAKEREETLKDWDAGDSRARKLMGYTDAEIAEMRKEVKFLQSVAKEYDPYDDKAKHKSAKGKDEIAELWKNRLKAIQDFYKRYEELRKHFDEAESLKRAKDAFQGLFNVLDMDMGKIVSMGMDKQGLANNIKDMLGIVRTVRPKLADEFENAFADTQIQVDFKIKEDSEKQLKSQLDEMFANYELTEELKKLGVSVDLIFMLGGKPTDLQSLTAQLKNDFDSIGGKSAAENVVKMYEDAFKKIADLEHKQHQAQLKNYVKYLTESMGERARIEIKALQDVNKIRSDAELDAFSKEQAIMQRRKKMSEELSKMDLDSLKSSDVYISVFKDLESASKEQLQYVLNKLRELQSTFKDLSPAQVKSIASEMKKIEDALADKDSIRRLGTNLKESIEYARQRNDLLREQTRLQTLVGDSDKALQTAQTELYQLELKRASIQDKNTDEWKEANDAVEKQRLYVLGLQAQIKALQAELEKVTGKINDGESAIKGWQRGLSNVHAKINEVKGALDTVFEGLDSMGLVNDAFRDIWDSVGELLGGLDTFMSGLESMDFTKPFSIITGSIKAIGGIAQTIGAAFGIGDKKKERDIQRLVEKVETLDKAYQHLEKSIDDAYRFDDYNAGYAHMQKNLDAQKKAYEEMIRLEEAKKKTDDEKIKEYNEKIEELTEKQKELRKERIEVMGSTTDYLSEAQSFVDAWLDAYKDTGNGLDALSESWEEFIENLFVKQGAAQIVSERLKKVIDTVNKAIESGATDFNLAEAVNNAREQWKEEAEKIEPLLEQLFGSYGLGGGVGELMLSDLQKGIQNITEPQAAAIESYLNSMRFAVFRHTEQLDTLIATIQMQYGSGAENPVVTELKGIRGVLDNIDRRLASVINTQGRNATLRIGAN